MGCAGSTDQHALAADEETKRVASYSGTDFVERDSTAVFLDWDDTLFPSSWLQEEATDGAPDEAQPDAAQPTGSHVHMTDWDYSCSDDYTDCSKTLCCGNQRFGCYKSRLQPIAVCRPKKDPCVDDQTWLCPGW